MLLLTVQAIFKRYMQITKEMEIKSVVSGSHDKIKTLTQKRRHVYVLIVPLEAKYARNITKFSFVMLAYILVTSNPVAWQDRKIEIDCF